MKKKFIWMTLIFALITQAVIAGQYIDYMQSTSSNGAGSGVLRLSNTDKIAWRNAANSADLSFGMSSDVLQYLGIADFDGVTINDGTAGAPGFTFASDATTGIYSPASNTVALAAGGYAGLQVKKSTGAYANVGLGGNASVSDAYPLLIERSEATGLNVQVSNPNGGASAAAKIVLKGDTGSVATGEIMLWPAAQPNAAYSNRFVMRSSDTADGISIVGSGSGSDDVRFYNGGVAAANETVRIETDGVSIDLDGTVSRDASLAFDVTGTTTQGAKPAPELTTTQMNAISTPADGAVVYNTTANNYYFYNGTVWAAIGATAGASPTASLIWFAGTAAPTGWLIGDGSAVSRTTYGTLYTAIGTNYGNGDGSTTFNLPDCRGRFIRGFDNGVGNDPDAASRTAISGGNTGDNVGSYQAEDILSHTHDVQVTTSGTGGTNYITASSALSGGVTAAFATATGGNETRPLNLNANCIIKY